MAAPTPPEVLESILSMRADGMLPHQIAAKLGRTAKSVQRILATRRAAGDPRAVPAPVDWKRFVDASPPAQERDDAVAVRERARALLNEGRGVTEVARLCGVNHSWVQRLRDRSPDIPKDAKAVARSLASVAARRARREALPLKLCLCCRRQQFRSTGPGHRLCDDCRRDPNAWRITW